MLNKWNNKIGMLRKKTNNQFVVKEEHLFLDDNSGK